MNDAASQAPAPAAPAPTEAPKPDNPEPLSKPADPGGRDTATPTPDSTEHPKQ